MLPIMLYSKAKVATLNGLVSSDHSLLNISPSNPYKSAECNNNV